MLLKPFLKVTFQILSFFVFFTFFYFVYIFIEYLRCFEYATIEIIITYINVNVIDVFFINYSYYNL